MQQNVNQSPWNILLFPNLPVSENILREVLLSAGIASQFIPANSLAEVRFLLKSPVDLILTGVRSSQSHLPCQAIQLVQELRIHTPVWIIAEPEDEDLALRCLQMGAAGYSFTTHLNALGIFVQRAWEYARTQREVEQLKDYLNHDFSAMEGRFRRLVEEIPAITYLASAIEPFQEIYISPQIEALTGYPAENWALWPGFWDEIIHPEDLPEVNKRFYLAMKTRTEFEAEYRFITHNGDVKWVHDHSRYVHNHNNSNDYWEGVIVDITDRKLSEETLRQTTHWLSEAERIGRIGGWALDLKTNLVWGSPEARAIFGIEGENFDLDTILSIILPQYHHDIAKALDCLVNGIAPFDVELEIERRTDNARRNIHSISEYDPASQRVFGIIQDITERKQSEAQLIQQIRENKQRLEELETLTRVSLGMREAREKHEFTTLLVEQSMQVLRAQSGSLLLIKDGELMIEHAQGIPPHAIEAYYQSKHVVIWNVIREGASQFIEDLRPETNMEGFDQHPFPMAAVMLIPLQSYSTSIGLLFLGYNQPQTFTASQRNLINAIADMAGNALSRMGVTETLESMVASRTQELDSIYQVTAAATESFDLNSALGHAVRIIAERIHVDSCAIFLPDETSDKVNLVVQVGLPPDAMTHLQNMSINNSPSGWVIRNQKPLLIPDLVADPRTEWGDRPWVLLSYLGMPMRVREQVVGVLSMYRLGGISYNLEEMTLISFIADHLGLIVENTRLYQNAEHHAVMEERARLARELHDSLTQQLYAATLYAAGMREFLAQGNLPEIDRHLKQLGNITQTALKEMRLLVYELRSPALTQSGLLGGIENRLDAVERRIGIDAIVEANPLPVLPLVLEEHLYRILMEALNNSLRHASASQVIVRIQAKPESIIAQVQDNGVGFCPQHASDHGGFGLISIKERVARLEGALVIDSAPGKGAIIQVTLPYARPKPVRRRGVVHVHENPGTNR